MLTSCAYAIPSFKSLTAYSNEINEDSYNPELEKFSSRHWYIPKDGHDVWPETYRRRDFFQWLLSKSKKDIFLIGAYTGLRVSDLNQLNENNIITIENEQYLKIKTQKTGTASKSGRVAN